MPARSVMMVRCRIRFTEFRKTVASPLASANKIKTRPSEEIGLFQIDQLDLYN